MDLSLRQLRHKIRKFLTRYSERAELIHVEEGLLSALLPPQIDEG